jgi:hypothetical protein
VRARSPRLSILSPVIIRKKNREDKQQVREATSRPDVIIFKHDHARNVEPMRVYPTDKHAVLFDEAEA